MIGPCLLHSLRFVPYKNVKSERFFTRSYGICMESLHMQEAQPHQQLLFARIIFQTASTMEMILGTGKVKFTMNGKHVWARKFVPKHAKSSLSSPLPPSHLSDTSFWLWFFLFLFLNERDLLTCYVMIF